MSEKTPNPWTEYPHQDYVHTINEIFAHGARLDAWRRFLQGPIVEALHRAGAMINIVSHGEHLAMVSFPKDFSEPSARRLLAKLARPAGLPAFDFLRSSLSDPRAYAEFPLSCFVEADVRALPLLRVSIHQHWQVLLEHFSFSKQQDRHVKYDTLLFRHPQSDYRYLHDGQQVARLEILKAKTPGEASLIPTLAERREALFQEIESHAAEWQFSILERWTLRHLNNEPQPEEGRAATLAMAS